MNDPVMQMFLEHDGSSKEFMQTFKGDARSLTSKGLSMISSLVDSTVQSLTSREQDTFDTDDSARFKLN